MSWITRFNQFNGLISSGKIPKGNKTRLSKYLTAATNRKNLFNMYKRRKTYLTDYVTDYNTLYSSFAAAINLALADLTTDYTIPDVTAFVDLLERYCFYEEYILYMANRGTIAVTNLQLKVLSSLSDPGTAGDIAIYQGDLYVYSSSWVKQTVKQFISMSWITRFNLFNGLISNGKITAANKAKLRTYNDEAVRRHHAINYCDRPATEEEPEPDSYEIIADYNAVYTSFETAVNLALADLTTDYTIPDVSVFVDLLERYCLSEGLCLYLAARGELAVTDLKILSALTDSGTAGDVALYQGGIYVYGSIWEQKSCKNYKTSLFTVPAAVNGDLFLAADNTTHTSVLYVNGTALEVNSSELEVTKAIKKGVVYYYNNEWLTDADTEDYRYIAAAEDYYELMGYFPDVLNNFISKARNNSAMNIAAIKLLQQAGSAAITAIEATQSTLKTDSATGKTAATTLYNGMQTAKAGLEDIIEEISEYIPGYSQQQAG